MSWIARLLGRSDTRVESVAPGDGRQELLDGLQKMARAQAKQGLRLEELESKIEGGFADLRAQLDEAQRPARDVDWSELLDAMDVLDEAARLSAATSEVGTGLRAVLQRMDRFLGAAGVERRTPVGTPPDGRHFRVVGTEAAPALPDGVVARVVRAAVLRGDEVLREGEVIVARRIP